MSLLLQQQQPQPQPRIAILTFVVGADYKRAMEPGLASKRAYAAKHGYDFHEGGEDVWDRRRPIPWSKIRFILKHLDDYDFLFWSDADVIITNPDIRLLEDVFEGTLPTGKDMAWCRDACGNLNNGNVFFRGRSAWARDFLQRAYAQVDLLHHIWWDNAAFIRLFETVEADRAAIETVLDPARFNSYLFNRHDSAVAATGERLYKPGDFLVHFAGVYDLNNIHRMMIYVGRCAAAGLAPDVELLTQWRRMPPMTRTRAFEDGTMVPVPAGTTITTTTTTRV